MNIIFCSGWKIGCRHCCFAFICGDFWGKKRNFIGSDPFERKILVKRSIKNFRKANLLQNSGKCLVFWFLLAHFKEKFLLKGQSKIERRKFLVSWALYAHL